MFTPRSITFDEPFCPRRSLLTTITISALARGRPSGPTATAGFDLRMFTWSSVTPLEISLLAPFLSTSALSGEPVVTSEARNPAASARAPMKIDTVRPMPIAVVAVDAGRLVTLRRL